MAIKKTLIAASVCLAVSGCAHKLELLDTVVDLNQPHRVIEHDFRKKYGLVYEPEQVSLPAFSGPEPVPSHVNVEPVNSEPAKTSEPLAYIDIEFFNESAVVKNHEEVIRGIKESIDANRFLIIGHSHGKSVVGVENLASKRARYLSNVLVLAGVPRENIFYISSFSDGGQPYEIPKGARVVGLPNTLSADIALLTGLTPQEDKS